MRPSWARSGRCDDCGHEPCACDLAIQKDKAAGELGRLRAYRIQLAQMLERIHVELRMAALRLLPDGMSVTPVEDTPDVDGAPLDRCPSCRTLPAMRDEGECAAKTVYCPLCLLNTGPQATMQAAKALWQGLPRRKV